MAVKAAVVGYEDYMKPISAKSESDSEAPASDEAVTPASGDELEEEISEEALDDLEKKDLEALLLSDLGDDEGGSNADEGVCGSSHAALTFAHFPVVQRVQR